MNESESKDLKGIESYAEQMRVPTWIFRIDSGEMVFANPPSQVFFKSLEGEKNGKQLLEDALRNELSYRFKEAAYFVSTIALEIGNLRQNLQLIGNKLNEEFCSISLVQLSERQEIELDRNTRFLFCNLEGKILDYKSEINRFGSYSNLLEIFAPQDQLEIRKVMDTLKNSSHRGESAIINELSAELDGRIQLLDIEITRPDKNSDLLGVLISGAHYQNELMLEKSRAELAEEINEILKLEIEEHKKTQVKLDESEVLSTSIIDSSLHLIITFDKNMRITEFNRKATTITGYHYSDIIGTDVNEILENNGDVENVMMLVNSTGSYEGELVCRRKDGTKFSVFASVTLLENNKGVTLGYVCSMRDTTELKSWQQKFAITEERYTDLFENATDLIQGIDIKGNFIYTNKSWYKHLGYTKADRAELSVFDILAEENKQEYKAYFKKVVAGEPTQTRIWTLVKKNGENSIVESISNLKMLDGKPQAVRSIMRDVTEATKVKNLAEEQRAKMEAVIESGNIMFWTVNRSIKLTSFNREYEKTIERLYNKKPILDGGENEPKVQFAPDEYHSFWQKKYEEVFTTRQSVFFQTKTKDKEGKVYFREIFLRPILTKGKVDEVSGVGVDITDKKLVEQKIDEQSAKIRTIFDSTNHVIWSFDTEGRLTSFNEVMKHELYERYNIDLKLGQSGIELAKEMEFSANTKWNEILRRILEGERIQFEAVTRDKNNKKYIEEISISPIYNSDGEIVEMAGIAQNVTFKRASERKLKEQAAKISAIFDSTAMLIWTIDENMRIVSFNKIFGDQYFKLLGKEVSIGSNFVEIIADYLGKEPFKNLKNYFKSAFKGKNQQFEGVLKSVDGRKVWMESFFNPIYSDNNEIKEISCLSHNITDKKSTEKQMRESIYEKEILLQEVHHRVKNNLQVISSILNLQSAYVKDENSLSILRESQNRIKSMSFIHESLYQTKDFAHIEFREYILSLSKNLIHSYSMSNNTIRLNSQMDKTYLSLDQAIPCGLIANELISNALKYAFENNREGEILISLRENKNHVTIVIGDNGIGLPPGFDYENSESLGLQLVYTLVDQLDATIKVETGKGTKYLITFEKQ